MTKEEKENQKEINSFVGKTLYNLIKEYNKKKKFKESERENSLKEIAEKLKQELEIKNIFLDSEICLIRTNQSFLWFEENFEIKGTSNKKIFVTNLNKIPKNFCGTVVYKYKNILSYKDNDYRVKTISSYKKGKLHRIDGPAVEDTDGTKEWWVEGIKYSTSKLQSLIESSVYLGKSKDKYNIEWLKFLVEDGIEEFPHVPGIEQNSEFKILFDLIK